MAYRRILGRAWAATRQYKVLWLFGLLASFSMRLRVDLGSEVMAPARPWIGAHVADPSFRPAMIGLLTAWLLVGLAFGLLRVLGRSGLVDQVNAIEEGHAPTVRGGWGAIRRYGGRVLGIAFLFGLPTVVAMGVGWLPLIEPLLRCALGLTAADGFGLWSRHAFSVPLGLLSVVFTEFFGVIGALSERACVLEDLSVRESIRAGWALFYSQFQRTVLLWLVLLAVRVTIFLALLVPVLLLAGLFSLPFRPLAASIPAASLLSYLSIGAFVWALELAIGGVLAPFRSAYWTLAYRHLRRLRQVSERVYARVDQPLPLAG